MFRALVGQRADADDEDHANQLPERLVAPLVVVVVVAVVVVVSY